MNTIFKKEQYHNHKCLQDPKAWWGNVDAWSMGRIAVPWPESAAEENQGHVFRALHESERERGDRIKWPRMFTFMGTLAIMEYDIPFFNKVGAPEKSTNPKSHD